MRSLKIIVLGFMFFSLGISVETSWAAAPEDQSGFVLVAKFAQRKMEFFRVNAQSQELVHSYPIAVPKKSLKNPPAVGRLKEIWVNPPWWPTEKTKQDRLKKGIVLPDKVKPREPNNAMGKIKFLIDWQGRTARVVRLHGTNEPKSIGQRITRNCVRLHNEDAFNLAGFILGEPEIFLANLKNSRIFKVQKEIVVRLEN
ncbi:L,D-transpeptidase [Patescibacteria group bacterium]|nr:L,D-transpeptidase [Patescibacteria group bacterium]